MKNINERLVANWMLKLLPAPAALIEVNRPPAPFPGRWPTRVAVINRDGKNSLYLGKLGRRPRSLALRPANTITAEYDKQGIVAFVLNSALFGPNFYSNSFVWPTYHPGYKRPTENFAWLLGGNAIPKAALRLEPRPEWRIVDWGANGVEVVAERPRQQARGVIAHRNWLAAMPGRRQG